MSCCREFRHSCFVNDYYGFRCSCTPVHKAKARTQKIAKKTGPTAKTAGASAHLIMTNMKKPISDSSYNEADFFCFEADFSLRAMQRPADISIFSVKVVVNPAIYLPEGATVKDTTSMQMTYYLNLPQETVSTSTRQNPDEAYGTPRAQTRTLAEFSQNSVPMIGRIGRKSGYLWEPTC
jgi:hypothetical protein